jgi:Tol biopolymer transport system component
MKRLFRNRAGRGARALVALGSLCLALRAIGHARTQIGTLHDPRETYLANVRQLTFGGQNAEAYFSPDGRQLTFQSQRDGHDCDQQYVMDSDGANVKRISNGQGRTTCGWWMKDGKRLLFSSTHGSDPNCPPKPDYSRGYVWPVYPTYRIYTVRPDGSDLRPLFPAQLKPGEEPGYNAESVLSPDGKKIVFTSDRGGDLDIWVMDVNGRNAKQLTRTLGYDGGPWWSPDGRQIAFRAYHPETPEEIADYRALLAQHLIRPTTLDLYVMNADGSNVRRITNDRAANIASFAPSWLPDGKGLIFASNRDDPKRRKFEVYTIKLDGTGLERITYGDQFDGFPNFSPDGKRLVWASNRNGKAPHETNLFIADWVP